jgi:Transposase, Mutator family
VPRGRPDRERLRCARGRDQSRRLRESLGLDVVTSEDGRPGSPSCARSWPAAAQSSPSRTPSRCGEQHGRIVAQLEGRFREAAALLDEAAAETIAFTGFPKEHWRQLWSNNSLERLNKEIRRRTNVVGIFPDRPSIVRLVAPCWQNNDEWQVARRYMSTESIAKALADSIIETEEVIAIEAAA